jgi:glycosyltransferase involved in cell wall biosynthesis
MAGTMRLTVVMTSRNEAKTVATAFQSLKSIAVEDKEIIVIDNNSNDGTKEILREYQKNEPGIKFVLQDKNFDFPYSVQMGLNTARGRYTYIHHADDEYDYRYVPKMLEYAEKNDLDILLGSRTKDFKGSKWQLIKKRPAFLAALISTGLVNFWYDKHFTDIIGSRMYRTETIRKVPISDYHHGFDFESISRICKLGLKMDEMAIGYTPRACQSDKKIKWYNMIDALIALFKTRYFDKEFDAKYGKY